MGVIQLLNKKSGGDSRKDEECVAEIAKALGTAFTRCENLQKATVEIRPSTEQRKISQQDLDVALTEAKKARRTSNRFSLRNTQNPKAELGKSGPTSKCPYIEYNERGPSSTRVAGKISMSTI